MHQRVVDYRSRDAVAECFVHDLAEYLRQRVDGPFAVREERVGLRVFQRRLGIQPETAVVHNKVCKGKLMKVLPAGAVAPQLHPVGIDDSRVFQAVFVYRPVEAIERSESGGGEENVADPRVD